MKNIVIIGGGFTGTMTAVQLINNAESECPFTLSIICNKETFNKGVAYYPYSKNHLLNVIAAKMSAFPDKPEDFLDWVMKLNEYKDKDRTLLANAFLPRMIYGEYLTGIWKEAAETAKQKNIKISVIDGYVDDIEVSHNSVILTLLNEKRIETDYCIIATGNSIPENPQIKNNSFFESKNYYRNPWSISSVIDTDNSKPVLIIGNGLTMVDTIIGLIENGFKNKVFSISPNGFNILPHRHNGVKYSKLIEELTDPPSLSELVSLFNKHRKIVREYGISAEPVVDSLRPYSQMLWKNLNLKEREIFMSRLRHLWGVARHRIPTHIHDFIQRLRIDGKLQIHAGKIIDINEDDDSITVDFFDKKESKVRSLIVSRIINCTGPNTDIEKMENGFLKKALLNGLLIQDELKLGIKADTETFELINSEGKKNSNLFTLGSNLKGELWESTAVNELRYQAEQLAVSFKRLL